jgi:DNA polymerase-4
VGTALQTRLAADGIIRISDLRRYEENDLVLRYGAMGRRLCAFAHGRDERSVIPDAPAKSISAETTFDTDIGEMQALLAELWPLCEKVSRRLKRSNLAGGGVTLKLKTRDFRTLTRSRRFSVPTQLAEIIYREAQDLLQREADGRKFRLIGAGVSDLVSAEHADPPDLLDPERSRRAKVEAAIDSVRAKLGDTAIRKGRGMKRG